MHSDQRPNLKPLYSKKESQRVRLPDFMSQVMPAKQLFSTIGGLIDLGGKGFVRADSEGSDNNDLGNQKSEKMSQAELKMIEKQLKEIVGRIPDGGIPNMDALVDRHASSDRVDASAWTKILRDYKGGLNGGEMKTIFDAVRK